MDTGLIPLVKGVVIIFAIVITVFIVMSFGFAKLKALVTGKKPPKTGPELYAAQLAMQKNPNQPQVKKARIPSKEKKPGNDTSAYAEARAMVENQERVKANPPVRRNDEARRSRTQSRVSMSMVQKTVPKRNVFQVVNAQQASYRGVGIANIDYSPQNKPSTTQASMRNQTLFAGQGNSPQGGRSVPGKTHFNFR
ncbi:MAG: hypothetical protein IPJ75_01895 [Ignavibacteriales bacterium]|nr:hypothetical protein [Ignavibacteriales bacterium]